jgi:hypothetical protein
MIENREPGEEQAQEPQAGSKSPFNPQQNRFPREDEKGHHKSQPRGEEEDAQGKA